MLEPEKSISMDAIMTDSSDSSTSPVLPSATQETDPTDLLTPEPTLMAIPSDGSPENPVFDQSLLSPVLSNGSLNDHADEDDEDVDDGADDLHDIEPKFKYERLLSDRSAESANILFRDSATTLAVHAKFLALGTKNGEIHVLDLQGNRYELLLSCIFSNRKTSPLYLKTKGVGIVGSSLVAFSENARRFVPLVLWSVDWLIDWLIDWLVGWLIDWLVGWLIDWLIDWLIGWSVDWLIDWLSSVEIQLGSVSLFAGAPWRFPFPSTPAPSTTSPSTTSAITWRPPAKTAKYSCRASSPRKRTLSCGIPSRSAPWPSIQTSRPPACTWRIGASFSGHGSWCCAKRSCSAPSPPCWTRAWTGASHGSNGSGAWWRGATGPAWRWCAWRRNKSSVWSPRTNGTPSLTFPTSVTSTGWTRGRWSSPGRMCSTSAPYETVRNRPLRRWIPGDSWRLCPSTSWWSANWCTRISRCAASGPTWRMSLCCWATMPVPRRRIRRCSCVWSGPTGRSMMMSHVMCSFYGALCTRRMRIINCSASRKTVWSNLIISTAFRHDQKRSIDCLIECLFDCLIKWSIDWLINELLDWLIDWLINCSIDRLIDWLIDELIDCSIDWLID